MGPPFNVISIEHFGIFPFKDAALATSLAIVQAFPGVEHVGPAFLFGGVSN